MFNSMSRHVLIFVESVFHGIRGTCRQALLLQAYAKLRTDTPELLDLVAQFAGQDLTDDPMAVDGESTAPVANAGKVSLQLHSLLCRAAAVVTLAKVLHSWCPRLKKWRLQQCGIYNFQNCVHDLVRSLLMSILLTHRAPEGNTAQANKWWTSTHVRHSDFWQFCKDNVEVLHPGFC